MDEEPKLYVDSLGVYPAPQAMTVYRAQLRIAELEAERDQLIAEVEQWKQTALHENVMRLEDVERLEAERDALDEELRHAVAENLDRVAERSRLRGALTASYQALRFLYDHTKNNYQIAGRNVVAKKALDKARALLEGEDDGPNETSSSAST